jgi:hypothetical protein
VFTSLQTTGQPRPSIVRVGFDAAAGTFAGSIDSLYSGDYSRFGVTSDGTSFVVDEGTAEYSGYVVDTRGLLRGELPEASRLIRATAPVRLYLSPDGRRVMTLRVAGAEERLAVMPSEGGPETPLPLAGSRELSFWADSVHVAVAEVLPEGIRLSLIDVRGGPRTNVLQLADSALNDMTALPGGGWAWLPYESQHLRFQRPSDSAPVSIPRPEWFISMFGVTGVAGTGAVGVVGWDARTNDTLGLGVFDLATGGLTFWDKAFGEDALIQQQRDGSLVFGVARTQETMELRRVRGPGRVEVLGTIPRPVWRVNVSGDLSRVAVVVREQHGDVWMSRVVVR